MSWVSRVVLRGEGEFKLGLEGFREEGVVRMRVEGGWFVREEIMWVLFF